MSFLYGFLLTAICLMWSFVFMKTYQLVGYKMREFFCQVWQLKWSLGDKNKLKFTKRMTRFIILLSLIIYALMVIICQFSAHWALILLNFAIIFVFIPFLELFSQFLLFILQYVLVPPKNTYTYK